MQGRENRAEWGRDGLDVISVRRNPYLVEYEGQKRNERAVNGSNYRYGQRAENRRRPSESGNGRPRREVDVIGERSRRRPSESGNGRPRREVDVIGERSRRRPPESGNGRPRREVDVIGERNRRRPSGSAAVRPSRQVDIIEIGRNDFRTGAVPRNRRQGQAARRAAAKRRKRQMRRRRLFVAACLLCLFMIGGLVFVKAKDSLAAEQQDGHIQEMPPIDGAEEEISSTVVQGLPAEVYAKHPAWEENFLPLNYYSRPGDALPEVKDIFVHYTANPGTSAAQNRSYFEQQKDMHEASVSAHFIIGYDGEIIQCVPLDEIAYAVQTRNYDSISIECCYKAEDGSFTQETYDSLIGLLAWLTDAYGLDTDHILRHYDCGGKRCPLYYTENEDAWNRLKEDVAGKLSL